MNKSGKGRRKLLPSDTSMDDSVQEHKKSEKWWEVLDDGSNPSSCDPRYDRSGSTSRNLDPKSSIRGSMSFMSQRTSSSGFSCSDFSVEAKDVSRIMPKRKRNTFFVSPRQYNVAMPNETAVTFERTLQRSSDPDVSSFKIDSSLEDGSRNEHTENINPLLNRRPNRKIEHSGNNYSRVLSDMTHLVSHTSVSDTIYEQVEKNNSGVISDIATCDIFKTDNYEAPATATYCRQTVERNGATTTYVTISEVKERVQIQNRSCRVPSKNQKSSFEISQAVMDLSYGSDCMIVEHISSPKNPSISHFHGGSGKKEGKLKDCNGLEILIETQNSIESFSGAEVEDIGDVLNRSGPIEKRKSRHKRGKSGSKTSLDMYTREFKEILSEQPYSCKQTTHLSPDKFNHDINQTSSFSASESFEKSGRKKSGRKIRKRSQGEDFAKELSAGAYDRRASDSFNENTEVDIPDYPYFTSKRKRGRVEQKMSINSAVFDDAFDPESHTDSHCSTGKNSSANSSSSYATEANSSKRSRKNLNFNKMNSCNGDQGPGSDSLKLRAKYSSHRSASFDSDSVEIPDSRGSISFRRMRKSVLPISANAFADVLNCEVVPDHPGFNDAEDGQDILAQKNHSIQHEAPDIAPIQCPVNAKEMESVDGREVSLKRDNSHSPGEDNSQSLDEVVTLGVDEINRLTSRRKKKGLSVNSNEFSEALGSDLMSDASNSISLSTSHQEDKKVRKMSQSKEDKVQLRVNKQKRLTMDDGQSLDEISLLSDIDTSLISPLLGLKRKKKRHLRTDLNILTDAVSDHSQYIHSSDEKYSSEKDSLVCIGENLKPSDQDVQTDTRKVVDENAEIMSNAAYSVSLSTSYREVNKGGKKMEGSMEDKVPLRKSKRKQVRHDESQSLDEISIVSDIDAINVSPLLGVKSKKKNRLASSKAMVNEEEGRKEKLGEDMISDSKSIKFSSSKSMMNVESKSVSEENDNNSSGQLNAPILKRNRGKKTVMPVSTSVFADALGSDGESDCSNLLSSHEPIKGIRKDSTCELVEKCNGTAPKANEAHEEYIDAVSNKDNIKKGGASPTVKDNDEVGRQENLSEVGSSDSKSIKLSYSKSTVNVGSESVSGDNSNSQQIVPILRRNRGKKTVMPINTSVFAGALGSDVSSDCSNVMSHNEAVEGVGKDSSCDHVEKFNGAAPKANESHEENIDAVSNKDNIKKGGASPSIKDNDEVVRQEKFGEDVTSDSKSIKLSYSKSTVNAESESVREDNSSGPQIVPILRRNRGKKTVMPVSTSVFAGALGSDVSSDCSNVISSLEAVEGAEKDSSCEHVEKFNEAAPKANESHEEYIDAVCNKDNIKKGGASPSVKDNDEVGKQEKLGEDVTSDSKSMKLSYSKSTVNAESESVSGGNSSVHQNAPILRQNRGKKTVMPVNASVFAGALGSDVSSDFSNVISSHEAVEGVGNNSSCEQLEKCNGTAPMLDRMAMESEPHEGRTVTHSNKDNCRKGGAISTDKDNNEDGKQENLGDDVTSESKSIKLSYSKSTVNAESGSVNGDNSSGPQIVPILRRNRGKKTVMPVSTSVFAGALGSDVSSDCSNVISSLEAVEGAEKDSSCEHVEKFNEAAPKANESHEEYIDAVSNKDNIKKGGASPSVKDNDEVGKQEKLGEDVTSDSKSMKLSYSKSTVNAESESVNGGNSSGQQNAPILRRNRGKKTVMPVNASVFAGALGSDVSSDCSNVISSHEAVEGVGNNSSCEQLEKCNGTAPMLDRMAMESEPHEGRTVTHSNKDNCRKGGAISTDKDNNEDGKQENLGDDVTSESKSIKLSYSKSTVNAESGSVNGDNSSGPQIVPILRRNRGKKTVMPVSTSVFAGALGSDVSSDCSNVISSHEAVEGAERDSSCEHVEKFNGSAPKANESHEENIDAVSNKDNIKKGGASPSVKDNDEVGSQEKLGEDVTSDSKSIKLSYSKSTVNAESESVSGGNSSVHQNAPILRRNRGKKTVMPVNASVFAGALGSDVLSDCSNVISSHEAVERVRKDSSFEQLEKCNGAAPMLDRMAMESEPHEGRTVTHSNKDNCRKGGAISTDKDNNENGKQEKLVEDVTSESKSIKLSYSKSTVNVEFGSINGDNSTGQQDIPLLRRNRGKKTRRPVNTSVFAGVLGSIVEAHSSISNDPSKVSSNQDVVKGISMVQTGFELDEKMETEGSSKSHMDRVKSATVNCTLSEVNPIPTDVEKNAILATGENGPSMALVSIGRVEKSESLIVGGNDESLPVGGKTCTENPSIPIFQRIRRKRLPLPANSDDFAGVLGTDLESDSSIAASASESVVVENEDDSLLPDGVICNWKSDGYFESTRGFIVTDTKSPFSRIHKDFGDLSCISKETATEEKSLEEEDGDRGPKKDNQMRQSSPIELKAADVLITDELPVVSSVPGSSVIPDSVPPALLEKNKNVATPAVSVLPTTCKEIQSSEQLSTTKGVECVKDPIATSTILHFQQKGANSKGELLLQASEVVNLHKQVSTIKDVMNMTNQAIQPTPTMASPQSKVLSSTEQPPLPQTSEEIQSSKQTFSENKVNIASEAVQPSVTVVSTEEKVDLCPTDEPLPKPNKDINLTKPALTIDNLRRVSAVTEAVQPSPVVSSPEKEGFPCEELLTKQPEVHLPKDSSKIRNLRRGGKTFTGIPVPIASMRARKGRVVTGNEMPPQPHAKGSKLSSDSLSPVKRKSSDIDSKANIVSSVNPVLSSERDHLTSLESSNTVKKTLPNSKSPPLTQGTSVVHSSPSIVSDNKLSLDNCAENNQLVAVHDATFVKASTAYTEENNCINDVIFTIADRESEPEVPIPLSACNINNLTFIKSSSAFDHITSAISTSECGPVNKSVAPQEEMKSIMSSYEAIEAELAALSSVSQEIVAVPQVFGDSEIADIVPEKLPNDDNSQPIISSPGIGTSVKDHSLLMVSLNSIKSHSCSGQVTQNSPSQLKMTFQVVSPACPVSHSNAQDAPPNQIIDQIPGGSFVQIETEHQASIPTPAIEVSQVQEKPDGVISVETFTEDKAASQVSPKMLGKSKLIIDADTANAVVTGCPEAPDNASQPEVKMLEVSQSIEGDGRTPVVSIADAKSEFLHPVSQEEANNSGLKYSPLQDAPKIIQEACAFRNNTLSEQEAKPIESERSQSNGDANTPEFEVTSNGKPEVILPTDAFASAVTTAHLTSPGEIKLNAHSLVNDNVDQLPENEINLGANSLMKYSIENKSENLSTRIKIVENVSSIVGSLTLMNDPVRPRSSPSSKANFKYPSQTLDSELLMLSPLNLKLISSESSGVSTSSSAIITSQLMDVEFSGNPEVPSTSKCEESMNLHRTQDLTAPQNSLNSGPVSCSKNSKGSQSCDKSSADLKNTIKDLTPMLNIQSSGLVFNAELSSKDSTASHNVQQASASSTREALIDSMEANQFWITSHGEKSRMVTSSGERSLMRPYEKLIANSTGSTPTPQVSGPIPSMETSGKPRSREESMPVTRGSSLLHSLENTSAKSHKIENLTLARAKTLWFQTNDEKSEQSCSYQSKEESTDSTLKGTRAVDNSNSSAAEEDVGKIVDNVLKKLDDACARQTQRELQQAESTFKRFAALLPSKVSPDKRKKLRSCARGQVPTLCKRQVPKEPAEKQRRLPAWCSKTLKKMLVEAMEEREMPFLAQEEFLFDFTDIVKQVMKSKDPEEVKDGVISVQKQLFDLNIVWNLSDFFQFVRNYMPHEFRCRSIPCSGWDDPLYATWVDDSDLNKPLF